MSRGDEASYVPFDRHCSTQSDKDSDKLADAKGVEECNK